MTTIQFKTARIFSPLLQPARYKVAYGGRGSGKSRFFASLMIEEHLLNPGMRSVCIREVQKTLKDSSKRILEDELERYNLGAEAGFTITKEEIRTPGDGIIIFQGMQDHNAESIKSLAGIDRAWVEEAQTLSHRSLQLLRPTIREPGSQIWFSFNPRRKQDPVDQLFRQGEPPTDSIIVKANWSENPWFPKELEQERLDDLRKNPDQYANVWEGDYISVSVGAYYAIDITKARQEKRIGLVAADPLLTYRAFWDIGGTSARADACSIWVTQFVGREVRVLDYYEAVGQPLATHVNWLHSKGYTPGRCAMFLPHDGVKHDFVFQITYKSELKRAGYDVTTIPNQGAGAANQRIEATRRLFPSLRFNEATTQAGIDALGWYHEKRDESRNIGLGPEHDWSSHAADAFGLMAVVAEDILHLENRITVTQPTTRMNAGWMG